MPARLRPLVERSVQLANSPRGRRIGASIAGIVAAIGVIGFLVVPLLVKDRLVAEIAMATHRPVTLEQLKFNPYTLSVTLCGFEMKERDGSATAVAFDELYVNVSTTSIFRGALPVLDAVRILKPRVRVVRNEDKSYNYQDLIDEFMAKPAGPTPDFSLNNIEVIDGRIDFDDRPPCSTISLPNITGERSSFGLRTRTLTGRRTNPSIISSRSSCGWESSGMRALTGRARTVPIANPSAWRSTEIMRTDCCSKARSINASALLKDWRRSESSSSPGERCPGMTAGAVLFHRRTSRSWNTAGQRPVLRFRVEGGPVVFDDLVHGKMSFAPEGIGDFIIFRSHGMVAYNFACVIDDHFMHISHVIRGEDHLSNTPRQIMIYRTLGWEPPKLPVSTQKDTSSSTGIAL